MHGERVWKLVALAMLVALAGFSEILAVSRIFQVDELQNIYTARLIGVGADHSYIASAPLLVLGPLAWLTASVDAAADILLVGRLLFLPLFWLNVALIVVAAGLHLRSKVGVAALVASSTIAPLWDYGFEVRHDNVLVALGLAGFCLARLPWKREWAARFGVGVVSALMQFTALKAFVYWAPIILIALIVDRASARPSRSTRALVIAAGMAVGTAFIIATHILGGTWDIFSADTQALFSVARGAERFSPMPTLARMLGQSPLYLAALVVTVAWLIGPRGRRVLHAKDGGLLPELIWCLAGWGALLVNPTPFPYNLVLLVPQGAVLLIRTLSSVQGAVLPRNVLALLGLVHLMTWANATSRHLDATNDRQMQLIDLAEALTDPHLHRVLDGAGLVASRLPPGPKWLIHMLTLPSFANGTFPPFRAQLSSSSTPVVILSYRVASLAPEDRAFITTHYVPLAGDFWVAGVERRNSAASWDCLVEGRYFVEVEGEGAVLLGDVPLKTGIMQFARGEHQLRVADEASVRIYWLGPTVDGPLRIPPGEPQAVFVNWY